MNFKNKNKQPRQKNIMKKGIFTLSFLCCVIFVLAQSNQLNVAYNNTKLQLDNDKKHMLEAFDLSLIELTIETELTLYIEDFEVSFNNSFQKLDKKAQLIEVNPSKNVRWKTYQLVFRLENDQNLVDIGFFIKNEVLSHFMKLHFYKKISDLDISIVWKTPIQANREDKTGVETILPKYVVNLEINSSEPLLEDNFKILLDDTYQEDRVTPHKIKAKGIAGKNGKTIYQYSYTCDVTLIEGVNKVKLELITKHYLPQQEKFYSSVLYLNKVPE